MVKYAASYVQLAVQAPHHAACAAGRSNAPEKNTSGACQGCKSVAISPKASCVGDTGASL